MYAQRVMWPRLGLLAVLSLIVIGALAGPLLRTVKAAEILVEPKVQVGVGTAPSVSRQFITFLGASNGSPEIQGLDLSTSPPALVNIASGSGVTAGPVVNGDLVAWAVGGSVSYYKISTKTTQTVTAPGVSPTVILLRVSDPVILAITRTLAPLGGTSNFLNIYDTNAKKLFPITSSGGITAADISGTLVAYYDSLAKTISLFDFSSNSLKFSFTAPFVAKNLRLSGTTIVVEYQVPQDGQPSIYAYENSPTPIILVLGTTPALSGSVVVYQATRNGLQGIFGYDLVAHKEFQIAIGADSTPDISGILVVWTETTSNATTNISGARLAIVVDRFQSYFDSHDGLRLLGYPISIETQVGSFKVQYFQKGRLEDQRGVSPNPLFQFQYGLLASELTDAEAPIPVGGDASDVTYATIHQLVGPGQLIPPPANFSHGVFREPNGSVFIPLSPILARHAGHTVPAVFWNYMNRNDFFPAGWLHDIGLPVTETFTAHVTKNTNGSQVSRTITVQVFQRTILTNDPLNNPDFQVERANIGIDYAKQFPNRVPAQG